MTVPQHVARMSVATCGKTWPGCHCTHPGYTYYGASGNVTEYGFKEECRPREGGDP
jgi:hypothetical protein